MKLSITNWQQATNARVLVATVTALDAANNKADIAMGELAVAAVPIHYWCHHGVDTHAASRVLKVGDQVKALYTGNGAAPTAANLTVLGLHNEIRRCAGGVGIVCNLNSGAITAIMGASLLSGAPVPSIYRATPTRKLQLSGGAVNDTTLAAGQNDWNGHANQTISWMHGPFRYGPQLDASKSLWIDGVLWDNTIPGSEVLGACISGAMVIAITNAGGIYRRPLDKSSAWAALTGTGDIPLGKPYFFNGSGTEAAACDPDIGSDQGKVTTITISGDTYSASTWPTQVYSLVGDQYELSYTKFVDYSGDTLIQAVQHATRQTVVTMPTTITAVEVICVYGLEGSETEVWNGMREREEVVVTRSWLEFASTSIDLYASDVTLHTKNLQVGSAQVSAAVDKSQWLLDDTTPSYPYALAGWPWYTKVESLAFITSLDLRTGHHATYQVDITANASKASSGHSWSCDPVNGPAFVAADTITRTASGTMQRTKKINGVALPGSRNSNLVKAVDPSSETTTFDMKLNPAESYDPQYDNIGFTAGYVITHQTTFSEFMSINNLLMPNYQPNLVIADGMHGITYANNPKTTDTVTAWLHDALQSAYVNYSGGDIGIKLGVTNPFSIEDARVA